VNLSIFSSDMERPYLPEEKLQKASIKQNFILLITPLVMVFLFNVLFYFYFLNFPTNRAYWLVQTKWSILENVKEKVNWLILGDSSGNQGVDPAEFRKSFGGEALNLCTLADLLTIDNAWMLDEYLRNNPPPDNILIVHVYDIWQRDQYNYELIKEMPLLKLFNHELRPVVDFGKGMKRKMIFKKYFPIYHNSQNISDIIRLKEKPFQKFFNARPDGYMPLFEANPENVLEDVKNHKWFTWKHKFSVTNKNKAGLEAINDMAETYGFNVFIANSPINDKLYEDSNYRNYFSHLQDYLTGFCKSHPKFHYINNPPVTFPDTLMENADHLIDEGAKTYTELLVREIQGILNSEKH